MFGRCKQRKPLPSHLFRRERRQGPRRYATSVADQAVPVKRLLDLFCGAGGAARGYQQAGFEVTGVDIKPQPRYAGDVFVQGDALGYLAEHGHEFDAIHASPPCQAYSTLRHLTTREYPELLPQTRRLLVAAGRPWVIENVVGAPFGHYVQLCGTMFGLRTYRHRRFETSWLVMPLPEHPAHTLPSDQTGRYGQDGRWLTRKQAFEDGLMFACVTGNAGSYLGPAAMGIDWMTGKELSQAIPPAYTEWVGRRLRSVLP